MRVFSLNYVKITNNIKNYFPPLVAGKTKSQDYDKNRVVK